MEEKIKSLLIIRPDAIGDCVLITPAIQALKKRFPNASISVLAQPLTRDIFSTNPNVTEVLTDIKEIKPGKYDLSIHYFNELPYALAAKHAGIKIRLGDPSKFPVGWLYNLKYRQNWRDITKHDVEQNMLLLTPLGIKPPYPKLALYVDPTALKKVETLLHDHGVGRHDKLVGLHLSTGKGNKPWAAQNFGLVAEYLLKKGFRVVVSGQQKDQELLAQAQNNARGKIIDLTMQTNLKELIALTSKYSLFVGVDTGPFHIAAALGIPMVHLSTSKFSLPLRWGPWQNRHVLIRKRSTCTNFCAPANCKETLCSDEITPNEVIKAIELLLNGGGNLSQEEAYYDWCRQCFSIMITYRSKNKERAEEIYKTLYRQGYFAIMVDMGEKHNYQKLFKEFNVNIIHAINDSIGLRFQALVSGSSLITPALYVKDEPTYKLADQFLALYHRSFANSRV